MRAGVALGANLGDRLANLKAARRSIEQLPQLQPPVLASSIYETDPVDCDANAGKFLNAVIEIGYGGAGEELLRELRNIEEALGRPAIHARNASRTLDLDLLYFGELIASDRHLQLPHPRMTQRRFVLEPLAEIRPDLVLPGQGERVAGLLARLPQTQGLVRADSQW